MTFWAVPNDRKSFLPISRGRFLVGFVDWFAKGFLLPPVEHRRREVRSRERHGELIDIPKQYVVDAVLHDDTFVVRRGETEICARALSSSLVPRTTSRRHGASLGEQCCRGTTDRGSVGDKRCQQPQFPLTETPRQGGQERPYHPGRPGRRRRCCRRRRRCLFES